MTNKTGRLIYLMSLTAVFAALDFVITFFIRIPTVTFSGIGSGYLNLSDILIFALAALVGPVTGGLVGGISGLFADLASGFGMFAPYTLVIKFIEGVVSGYLFRLFKKLGKQNKVDYIWKSLISFMVGGLVMAALYMVPDTVTYVMAVVGVSQEANYLPIFVDLFFNVLQGVTNAVLGTVAYICLYKTEGLIQVRLGKGETESDKSDIKEESEKERK